MPTEKKLFFSCLISGLFVYLGMKEEVIEILKDTLSKLENFDGNVFDSWSLMGLCVELEELIQQSEDELEEDEEEKMFKNINKGLGLQK